MKVFAEVLPRTLGHVMHRANAELRRHAPDGVEFVDDVDDADLQILDVIGTGSLEYLAHPDHVLLQHCYLTTETQDPGYWLPRFRGARLVMSTYDLHALTGADDFALYRAPFGVDATVFRPRDVPRGAAIMTSGHDANGEAIRECYDAARSCGLDVLHLGRDFAYGPRFRAYEGVGDEDLARLYSSCRWVSGLRRGEGFELPVVEGLACGARPICFDTPSYRHWFGDNAVFVPEIEPRALTRALREVLAAPPEPVGEAEREDVVRRFDWAETFGGLWSRLRSEPDRGEVRARDRQ